MTSASSARASTSPELAAKAEELGELLAAAGCVVVCGGRDGVMAAVARGVKAQAAASASAIMPEADRSRANDDLTYSVCSAMGYARNLSVVASGDVVIAVGGAWGTLSEIALARNLGRTVVLLDSWTVCPPGADPSEGEPDGLLRAATPGRQAVRLALRDVRRRRLDRAAAATPDAPARIGRGSFTVASPLQRQPVGDLLERPGARRRVAIVGRASASERLVRSAQGQGFRR